MREFLFSLRETGEYLPCACTAGYAGEHNAVRVTVEIPQEMCGEAFSYYRLAFKTGYDQKPFLSNRLTPAENQVRYFLPQDLMVQGQLQLQLCAYIEEETDVLRKVCKGPILKMYIDGSIAGEYPPQSIPFTTETLTQRELENIRQELLQMAGAGDFDGRGLEVEVVDGDRLRVRTEGGAWQYTESLRIGLNDLHAGNVYALPSEESSRIELAHTADGVFIHLYLAQEAAAGEAIQTLANTLDTHAGDSSLHKTGADLLTLQRAGHYKGFFATAAALTTAHPAAVSGDYAIVGASNSLWMWNIEQSLWRDSGSITSVNSKTGDIVLSAVDVGALSATGTAVAAKQLETARKIGDASFNGTANITLTQMGAATAEERDGIYDELDMLWEEVGGAGLTTLWQGSMAGDGLSHLSLSKSLNRFRTIYFRISGTSYAIAVHPNSGTKQMNACTAVIRPYYNEITLLFLYAVAPDSTTFSEVYAYSCGLNGENFTVLQISKIDGE